MAEVDVRLGTLVTVLEGPLLLPGAVPRQKRYLDEMPGVPVGTVWDDIGPVQGQSGESLGYPTQKPLALLKRILEISSRENDIVLDAFCGCGTALVAAQNLKRQRIGIDISPTACRDMAKRLRKDCGLPEDEKLWKTGRGFVVRDLPWSEEQPSENTAVRVWELGRDRARRNPEQEAGAASSLQRRVRRQALECHALGHVFG